MHPNLHLTNNLTDIDDDPSPGKKTVFVTGGTGLVGGQLIRELLKQQRTIKALYRSQIPAGMQHPAIEWIKGDVLDISLLKEVMTGITHVYHCAAIVSFDPAKKMEMFKINIEGTANVVNAALYAGIEKMVFVSSVAALGRVKNDRTYRVTEKINWTKETSESNYSKSKYLAELEVWRGIGEGLSAVMVNPVIILGAGDWTKGSAAMFKSGYDEFPWYTMGSGGYVDVVDVVKAMTDLMESSIEAQRFILCAEHKTYKEIFTMIAEGFGKKPPHKEAKPFMAAIVWRLEAIKGMLSSKSPLLTKETATTALATVHFEQDKLLTYLPNFMYTPLRDTINRVCTELTLKYNLP
jgi:nucleoside-diphosphate-sugar epimerase